MAPKAKPARRKPIEVKCGSVVVKIYQGTNTVNDVDYPQFTLVYHDGVQRLKKRFASRDVAVKEANTVAGNLARGEHKILQLTTADKSVYVQALKVLQPLKIPLNVAVLEYASAVKGLPKGTTLKEAVDYFRKHNPAAIVAKTVREVADDMLSAKRTAKLSEVHIQDLESRLKRFSTDFPMNIGAISGSMIQAWLDGLQVSGRTKQNYLQVCSALFRFAIKRKYLTADALRELEAVQRPKEDDSDIEIYSPEEIQEVLNVARPEMIPFIAIGAFAGLRSAEIERLDWNEVNLAERHIEIKASKAKTAARRLAPITDNLAAWLTPLAKKTGQVLPYESWWNQIPKSVEAVNKQRQETARAAGKDPAKAEKFRWLHNALRHSFCSYRMAAIKNAAQVALEAGNSPKMIFTNYRQLVTEAEAVKWFAIQPV